MAFTMKFDKGEPGLDPQRERDHAADVLERVAGYLREGYDAGEVIEAGRLLGDWSLIENGGESPA